jgi:pyoverdine/dityrosine biosynthesis protein Dit1
MIVYYIRVLRKCTRLVIVSCFFSLKLLDGFLSDGSIFSSSGSYGFDEFSVLNYSDELREIFETMSRTGIIILAFLKKRYIVRT